LHRPADGTIGPQSPGICNVCAAQSGGLPLCYAD
jgi:hypothetical protein